MDTNIAEISDITDIDLSPGVIEKFLDEIYFFLVDNHMDSVLNEKYRANW